MRCCIMTFSLESVFTLFPISQKLRFRSYRNIKRLVRIVKTVAQHKSSWSQGFRMATFFLLTSSDTCTCNFQRCIYKLWDFIHVVCAFRWGFITTLVWWFSCTFRPVCCTFKILCGRENFRKVEATSKVSGNEIEWDLINRQLHIIFFHSNHLI